MPEEEGVSGKVWEGEETGCEEIGRVQHARGRYGQKDQRFISNTISLRQVPAQPCRYKGISKKGSDEEKTNEERGIRQRGIISILAGYLGERH